MISINTYFFLYRGIDKSQAKLDKLGKALATVDKKVADMKEK